MTPSTGRKATGSAGARNGGTSPSHRSAIGPSKPSRRDAVTVITKAPPFHTFGDAGLTVTFKSGRGGRTVSR